MGRGLTVVTGMVLRLNGDKAQWSLRMEMTPDCSHTAGGDLVICVLRKGNAKEWVCCESKSRCLSVYSLTTNRPQVIKTIR